MGRLGGRAPSWCVRALLLALAQPPLTFLVIGDPRNARARVASLRLLRERCDPRPPKDPQRNTKIFYFFINSMPHRIDTR